MHSKNKGKAHQINKKEESAAACFWECVCGSEVAAARVKGQTISCLHTHTYTRLLFSEQLLSPLHAGTSLGNHHGEASPKTGTGAPPKSESVCLPPTPLSLHPPPDDDAVPGKDSEFMVRLPIELTA